MLVMAVAAISCEYPYIFGTSLNSKGIANGRGGQGIAGAQTTAYGLDDVSQSVAYSNGTKESNARANGESLYSPRLHGANTSADAVNNGQGNALTDSVSKSFQPYQRYFNENYRSYIDFLNGLFLKYPERREEILKVVLSYSEQLKKGVEHGLQANDKKTKLRVGDAQTAPMAAPAMPKTNNANGYPATVANYDNAGFKSIGQTTFDYQRARGSGQQSAASTNSGTFRWNDATVHQGDAVGNAKQGWATSSSNDYGLGRVNYVNSEQNAGSNGADAQTDSSSNYYLAKDAVWNNGDAWGRAQGKDSLAFSNLNGNSYGYGAVNGDTNSYTDGDLSVSKSQIKGAPYLPTSQ